MRAVCVPPHGAWLCPARSHRHRRPPAPTRGSGAPRGATVPLGSLSAPLPGGCPRAPTGPQAEGSRAVPAVPCRRGALPARRALPPSEPGQGSRAAQRTGEEEKPKAAKQPLGPGTAPGAGAAGARWEPAQPRGANPSLPPRGTGSALPLRQWPRQTASTSVPRREKTALALLPSSLASVA